MTFIFNIDEKYENNFWILNLNNYIINKNKLNLVNGD